MAQDNKVVKAVELLANKEVMADRTKLLADTESLTIVHAINHLINHLVVTDPQSAIALFETIDEMKPRYARVMLHELMHNHFGKLS